MIAGRLSLDDITTCLFEKVGDAMLPGELDLANGLGSPKFAVKEIAFGGVVYILHQPHLG